MKRTAKAHWLGTLREGSSTLTCKSGVLNNTTYSFKSRFGDGIEGTNPEELLAASHAGCYTMAVASLITKRGLESAILDTEAAVHIEGSNITGVHLCITGSVAGLDAEEFSKIAKDAVEYSMISKVLKINITSESHFTA